MEAGTHPRKIMGRLRRIMWLIFSFKGRVGRRTYVIYFLCWFPCFAVYVIAQIIFIISLFETVSPHGEQTWLHALYPFWLIFLFSTIFWSAMPMVVKRYHDRGTSTTSAIFAFLAASLVGLLPLFLIYWAFPKGETETNKYGEVPKSGRARPLSAEKD